MKKNRVSQDLVSAPKPLTIKMPFRPIGSLHYLHFSGLYLIVA